MKAIKVKYIGPTGVKGGRLKASDADGNSKTISYPDDVSGIEERHFEAVKALCAKMKWGGEVFCGWYGNETFWVFHGRIGENAYVLPNPANAKAPKA